jgi:glycosyltransferase involved in cell wall biosynthesis
LNQKKLSLVLPVYNGENFIYETIKSILDQSFSDFDLLVVNDGSTDNTLDVINRFSDERIIVFNQEQKGIIHSFNSVLKDIKTEFIARVDADDIYFKEKFAKQILFLNKNKKTVLVGTNAFYMSEKSKISSIKITVPSDNNEIMKNLFERKRAIIQSTILARTEFLQKIEGYRDNVYPEDYDLFFRISKYGYINNLKEPLAAIRIHKSYSHKNLKMLIKNHNKLISEYSNKNNSSFISIYLNRMSLYYYLNKSKTIGVFTFTISLFFSPINSFKALLRKLRQLY